MSDEDYKDMTIQHDKHIDKLAISMEHVASEVGAMNKKLESIIDVISKQNILMEKFSNLEINLKESFGRVQDKIREIEEVHKSDGCQTMKNTKDRVEKLEDDFGKIPPSYIIKAAIAIMCTCAVSYGIYNEVRVNSINTNFAKMEQIQVNSIEKIHNNENQITYVKGRIK